jgi:hypothetical protein
LPSHYVELVSNYPEELLGTNARDFALLDDPVSVIEENISVRGNPFYGGVWPSRYFIIGTNGCGDLYVMNLEDDIFSTGFFDHERPAFLPHARSRAELISKLLQE